MHRVRHLRLQTRLSQELYKFHFIVHPAAQLSPQVHQPRAASWLPHLLPLLLLQSLIQYPFAHLPPFLPSVHLLHQLALLPPPLRHPPLLLLFLAL